MKLQPPGERPWITDLGAAMAVIWDAYVHRRQRNTHPTSLALRRAASAAPAARLPTDGQPDGP